MESEKCLLPFTVVKNVSGAFSILGTRQNHETLGLWNCQTCFQHHSRPLPEPDGVESTLRKAPAPVLPQDGHCSLLQLFVNTFW